jgi:hypothetical protein
LPLRVPASWEFQQRGDVTHEFCLCVSLRHGNFSNAAT